MVSISVHSRAKDARYDSFICQYYLVIILMELLVIAQNLTYSGLTLPFGSEGVTTLCNYPQLSIDETDNQTGRQTDIKFYVCLSALV